MKYLEDYDPSKVTKIGMTISGCFIILFKLVVFIFFEEKNIATWMILLLILMLGIFVIVNGRDMAERESKKLRRKNYPDRCQKCGDLITDDKDIPDFNKCDCPGKSKKLRGKKKRDR